MEEGGRVYGIRRGVKLRYDNINQSVNQSKRTWSRGSLEAESIVWSPRKELNS